MGDRRADLEQCAPWIREALKSTNDRAKALAEQVATLERAKALAEQQAAQDKARADAAQAECGALRAECEELRSQCTLLRASASGADKASPAAAFASASSALSELRQPMSGSGAGHAMVPSPSATSLPWSRVADGVTRAAAWTALGDPAVCQALSGALRGSDLDDVAPALYALAAARGEALALVLGAVSSEVEKQAELETLFRTNSLASKLLKSFTAHVCQGFVTAALQPCLDRVRARGAPLEVDPARAASPDEAERNVAALADECALLLSDMVAARTAAPAAMRRVCHHLAACVAQRFPGDPQAPLLGVGAYVFLRMLNPVLLAGGSRTHVLLSKVVQNVANQVVFGKKEAFMVPLNAVVKAQQERLNSFLLELAQLDEGDSSAPAPLPLPAALVPVLAKLAATALETGQAPPLAAKRTISLSVARTSVVRALATDLSASGLLAADGALCVAALHGDASAATVEAVLDAFRAVPAALERVAVALGPTPAGRALARGVWLRCGRDVLHGALGSALHSVVQGNLRHEVEPQRLLSVDDAAANGQALAQLAAAALEGLLAALPSAVAPLWGALAAACGPEDAGAAVMACVLEPALAAPLQYGLCARDPRAEAQRTLQLVTLVLRAVLDAATPLAPWFPADTAEFVQRNSTRVRAWLNRWALLEGSGLGQVAPMPAGPPPNLDQVKRALAATAAGGGGDGNVLVDVSVSVADLVAM